MTLSSISRGIRGTWFLFLTAGGLLAQQQPVTVEDPARPTKPQASKAAKRAQAAASKKLFADGIAATVNGKVVTKSEVMESVANQSMLAYRQIPDPKERLAKLREIEEQGLEALIDRELILAEHDKRGGPIKEQWIDSYINRFIRDLYKGDRNLFLADLRKARITLRKFREDKTKEFKVQRMQSAITRDMPPVSPGEVEQYYRQHLKEFQEEGQVKVRTITIKKYPEMEPLGPAPSGAAPLLPPTPQEQKLLAQDIHTKLRKGGNFAEMAKAYSKDSAAKEGGDRGLVTRDNKALNPFLTEAALSLKENEVSKLLQDETNYYILWAEDRRYGKTSSLEEVRDQVERRVTVEQKRKLVDQWLAALRSRALIKRY